MILSSAEKHLIGQRVASTVDSLKQEAVIQQNSFTLLQETMRAVSPVGTPPPPVFFCSGFIYWPPSSADSLLPTGDTETRIPSELKPPESFSVHPPPSIYPDTNRVRTAVCHLVSTVTCNGVRVNPPRPCLAAEGLSSARRVCGKHRCLTLVFSVNIKLQLSEPQSLGGCLSRAERFGENILL